MSQTVKMQKKHFINLLAISILALAASISYFTYELSLFIRQIPDILENVRVTSEKIEPALNDISEIRDLIKPIIVEVNGIRVQIPAILKEVKEVREAIPPILKESTAIRKQIPDALSSADKMSTSVVLISTQLKAYQPIANETLIQVEGTRKEIPLILDRTNAMIDRARSAAKEVSSGAITGAMGGLLTAPFRLVGSFGSSVLDLTKSELNNYSSEELEEMKTMTQQLLQDGVPGDVREWSDPESHRRLSIKLVKEINKSSRLCRELLIKSWINSKADLEKTVTVCKNESGDWEG